MAVKKFLATLHKGIRMQFYKRKMSVIHFFLDKWSFK